jgi:branched-subunit amino acid ABC-type transport system permease component
VTDFFQTLLTAVAVGSLYALIALGYTMVYGILKFINFAHSDVFVLGAWSSFTIATAFILFGGFDASAPPWWLGGIILVCAMLFCGGVGFIVERLAYKPLRKAPRLNVLITAIGVSLLLQNVGQLALFNVGPRDAVEHTGKVELTTNDRALKAAAPVDVRTGRRYRVEITPTDGSEVIKRDADLPPGRVEAGGELRFSGQVDPAKAAGATYTLVRVGEALMLPFGPSPRRMPSLLPDVVLNESVVSTGSLSRSGTFVRLSNPIELAPARSYRLEHSADGQRWDTARITGPEGSVTPETDVRTQPRVPAARADGGRYRIIQEPSVRITLVDVVIVASALTLMVILELLVFRTKLGTAMRAVSFNTETAALMGIPVDKVISFTFVLGSVLAAAAGFLFAMQYPGLNQPAHELWVLLGLKAFVAAVVGGIGNIRGAVLGGFLIAFIEFFGRKYLSTNLADVYVFGVLILVLLVKPSGILGTTVREKV